MKHMRTTCLIITSIIQSSYRLIILSYQCSYQCFCNSITSFLITISYLLTSLDNYNNKILLNYNVSARLISHTNIQLMNISSTITLYLNERCAILLDVSFKTLRDVELRASWIHKLLDLLCMHLCIGIFFRLYSISNNSITMVLSLVTATS